MTALEAFRPAFEAFRPDRGDDEGNPPVPGEAWRISIIGLHAAFVLVVGLAAVDVVVEVSGVSRIVALVALAVLALTYLGCGAPALDGDLPGRTLSYLAVLVVVLGVVGRTAPDSLFLLFLAYPQVWFLVERPRPGIRWTILLAASSTAGYAWALHESHDSQLGAVLSAAIGIGFSIGMGVWVSRVIDQSTQRGELIAQLEATRAELAVLHHERGVTAERERLASEVHDTLAQGYTSIVMLSQTASAALPGRPSVAAERLELIEEVARDNLREARAVVAAFSPSELQDATLPDALRRLVDRFARETSCAARVELDDPSRPLSRAEEVVLLRTAQEALTNVRRHAHASSVTLRLIDDEPGTRAVGTGPGWTGIEVGDDGIGFDPDTDLGTGLSGLRRRVEQAGGALDVRSAPGTGTLVTARLPAISLGTTP